MNTPHYFIYDTSLHINIPKGCDSQIRVRALYHRLMNLLRSRGFEVGFDTFNGSKGYKPRHWTWQTSMGQCRALHFSAKMNEIFSPTPDPFHGSIELIFWQNVVLEKGRTDGRHAFGKRSLMPYLIRLHYQLTVRHLIAFLHRSFPDTFTLSQHVWPPDKPAVGYDYLLHSMRGWEWHLPKQGYDPFTFTPGRTYSQNTLIDATGQRIVPGQFYKAYAGWNSKQLVQGRAVYAFNGNWLLLANENSQHLSTVSGQIYPIDTPLPRRRKHSLQEQLRKAKNRLMDLVGQQAFEKCVSIRDFITAHQKAA